MSKGGLGSIMDWMLVSAHSRESACSAGDQDSISEMGRSPGEGNGNPRQYSCLGNPTDRGAWRAIVRGIAKSWTWLTNTHTYPWYDNIDRWGLLEVIWFRWGHKAEILIVGLVPVLGEVMLSPPSEDTARRQQSLKARKRTLPRTWACGTLQRSSLQNCVK